MMSVTAQTILSALAIASVVACEEARPRSRATGTAEGRVGQSSAAGGGAGQSGDSGAGAGSTPIAGKRAPAAAPSAEDADLATPANQDESSDGGTTGAAAAGAQSSSTHGPLRVDSDVWKEGEQLDSRYRCPGPSPALRFAGGPTERLSYAVVVIDRSNSFFHWLIYDIPGDVTELPEGVENGATLDQPPSAKQGAAYNGTRGYVGPCGRNNNPYELTLYALDVASLPELSANASATAIVNAITAHQLESVAVTVMSGPGR
jgi:Raf kinase inhibitor-like YbhB/YbcL family protein